jgi:hypothetical protein
MWIVFISFIFSAFSAILYFYLTYRVVMPFFYKFNYPFTNATKFLLAFSFLGFAIVLFVFGNAANTIFKEIANKDFTKASLIFFALIIIAFASSVFIFRLSALIAQITMHENEKAELAKNNFQVAGFHGVVHLFFTLLLSEMLMEFTLKGLSNMKLF